MLHVLTENEIAVKAIEIINDKPGITTTELISELEKIFILHPDDQVILKNRKDTKFSQKVRNLVSHYSTNFFGEHVKKGPKEGRSLTWYIKDKGTYLLNDYFKDEISDFILEEEENLSLYKVDDYAEVELEIAENRMPEEVEIGTRKRYKTDQKIIKTYIKSKGYICENNSKHITFTANTTGNNYVEGHHLIPMKAQKDFSVNIDRSENLVSLCPVCHRQVHLGTKEECQNVLQKLYELKKEELERIGISITFEDLYNKYYAKKSMNN